MAKARTKRIGTADGGEFTLVPVQVKVVLPTNDLLRAHDQNFQREFGRPAPIVAGKDGDLARRLLQQYSLADLVNWNAVFFALPDPFIRASGYGFGIFVANIGKCITAGKVSRLNANTLSELDAGQSFAQNISRPRR